MQTFPPNSNGGGTTRGYQTLGTPPEGFEQQAPNNWKGVFSISSYTQYFNVDTDIVINRIMSSFYPIGGDFFRKIDAHPDLYGLIWISTTLICLLAGLGNCATYLMQKHTESSASWNFDVGYVNVATFAIYGYAILVPLAFYFLFQYLGANASLIRFWCMWGYSLVIFVISSFLLVVPVEAFRWIIILAAGIDSACFVATNLKFCIGGNDLTIVVVSAFCLQLALAIFIKAWFFA
ncbi:protein YIPF1 homolog isoform X2 [Ricinus communis]|nr:protein YIPF1 homolog isoform X2 [Ricinus communis]